MPKRTMPVKTRRIKLDGEYKGWWVDIRTNPPVGLLMDAVIAFQVAQAGSPEPGEKVELEEEAELEAEVEPEEPDTLSNIMPPIYDMLTLTVSGWNFVNEQGVDIPSTLEGIKQLPLDLIMVLAMKVQGAVVSLPLASSEPSSSAS